jgi:hypothetical protein
MNFGNIIDHPKTTVCGILIAITIAAPILSSFDFAHATVAGVCGLAGAIAAALLGAFSRIRNRADRSSACSSFCCSCRRP